MRITITGGGTGGHVYPALAVLDELRRVDPDVQAEWIGTNRKEAEIVPKTGIALKQIEIIAPRRSLSLGALLQNLRLVHNLITGKAFSQARAHLEKFKPDCVLSTGAYIAYPACQAARRLGIPLYLIEPNAVPGLVTRKTASYARAIFCARSETAWALPNRLFSHCKIFGTPVRGYSGSKSREEILLSFGLEPSRSTILVMGGSTGASFINEVVREHILPFVSEQKNLSEKFQLLHQTGARDFEQATGHSAQKGFPVTALPYIEDSTEALFACDVFIGRAGASAVGEAVKFGLPAIFIPYAHHRDAQQHKNAIELAHIGVAYLHEEKDFDPTLFLADLTELAAACGNESLRNRIREMDGNAAGKIASFMLDDLGARP